MSRKIANEMILASAGTGKTYALVQRYLRLLALGEDPAKIIALTFTRKAAGEFLQKIFLRLTKAASEEEEADKLNAEIGLTGMSCAFYREKLSTLVRQMGALQLSTIDGFFSRIVGAFPYELGLTRPHRVMDDFELGIARQNVLARLLGSVDEAQIERIIQLYKQLTWGVQEKNVYRVFDEHLKEYQEVFLENGNLNLWGSVAAIYPDPTWWMEKEVDIQGLLDTIEREVNVLGFKPGIMRGFNGLIAKFRSWQPGIEPKAGALWDSLILVREDLLKGEASVTFGRSAVDIQMPLSGYLYQMLQLYTREEIRRKVLITQSLGQLLAEYDYYYDRSIREAGSLDYADFPMLLIKGLCGEDASVAASDIVYRLDAQSDHWLLDEFQDTSRIQWKVLSAFVDEVVQDPGGERSFFYVGDVKQSIYGWRGGDARLFHEIHDYYQDGESGIVALPPLTRSWRSAPPVLDCVNTLFGDGLPDTLIGGQVAHRWKENWTDHVASSATENLPGYAGWGLVDEQEDMEMACVDLIKDVNPLEKGMTCAILMRGNVEVGSMAQALREAGIPASMEGVVNIARDNVVGTWVLAFLYSMARPDESFPRAFLSMTGIEMDEAEYRRLAGLLRTILTEDGYAEAIRRLLAYLDPLIAGDEFLGRRSEQLLESVTRFEGTDIDDLEGFIAFLENATIKESSLSKQVQVMTVHKAKGLDFDVVIVAGFGSRPLIRSGTQTLHVERNAGGDVEWVLDLPRKSVYEQDPVLFKAHAAFEADGMFEALCLLYVAMTRARQGLYCIAAAPTKSSKATRWHDLFSSAFQSDQETREEGLIHWRREWGDAGWFKGISRERPGPQGSVQLDAIAGSMPERRPTLGRMPSPSNESHGADAPVKRLRSNTGRLFGTRMHDVLSLLEWIDYDHAESIENALAGVDVDLAPRIRQMLATPLGRAVFERPGQACQLWREKPYVLRKEQDVAQGIIDRAIVFLDESGKAGRVVIYDFKTDSLDPDQPAKEQLEERYATQIERYREAVSVLTGLRGEKIETQLVPV